MTRQADPNKMSFAELHRLTEREIRKRLDDQAELDCANNKSPRSPEGEGGQE